MNRKAKRMKTGYITAALMLALLGTGCVREVTEQPWGKGIAELPEYPPLADYKLSLNLISKRELITGEGGRLMFALKNIDNKPIRLVEWYVNEPYNVQVYCQPWFPGMNGPDPNVWLPIRMEIDPKQTGRFPLDLMPNNEVQIEKELPFVDSLVVSPNGERRYFIKAELNLKSVKVESPLAAVAIRSPETKGKVVTVQ